MYCCQWEADAADMYIEEAATDIVVGYDPNTAAAPIVEAGTGSPRNRDSLDHPSLQAMVQVLWVDEWLELDSGGEMSTDGGTP